MLNGYLETGEAEALGRRDRRGPRLLLALLPGTGKALRSEDSGRLAGGEGRAIDEGLLNILGDIPEVLCVRLTLGRVDGKAPNSLRLRGEGVRLDKEETELTGFNLDTDVVLEEGLVFGRSEDPGGMGNCEDGEVVRSRPRSREEVLEAAEATDCERSCFAAVGEVVVMGSGAVEVRIPRAGLLV